MVTRSPTPQTPQFFRRPLLLMVAATPLPTAEAGRKGVSCKHQGGTRRQDNGQSCVASLSPAACFARRSAGYRTKSRRGAAGVHLHCTQSFQCILVSRNYVSEAHAFRFVWRSRPVAQGMRVTTAGVRWHCQMPRGSTSCYSKVGKVRMIRLHASASFWHERAA